MNLNSMKIQLYEIKKEIVAHENGTILLLLYRINTVEGHKGIYNIIMRGSLVDGVYEVFFAQTSSLPIKELRKRFEKTSKARLAGSVKVPIIESSIIASYITSILSETRVGKVILESTLLLNYLNKHGRYHGKKEKIFGKEKDPQD